MRQKDLKLHLENAKKLATLLDAQFQFAGIKFGMDPLINIVPAVGSIVGAITSLYVFWIAVKLKAPIFIYFKLLSNIAIDLVFGGIPVVGVIFDVFYKANVKNIRILEKIIGAKGPIIVEAEIVE